MDYESKKKSQWTILKDFVGTNINKSSFVLVELTDLV